jgi:ABC-2 type transport system permease protein
MRLGHGLSVFAAAARLGFKHALNEWLLLLGAFLIYATIILAYAGVFRAIAPADLAIHGLSAAHLIWYVGLTEFVLFCTSTFLFREFQNEIRSGQIDLFLVRPCPVWIVKLGEGCGQYLARLLTLSVPCVALAGFTAGEAGPDAGAILGLLLSAQLSSVLLVGSFFMVGASCLWVRQSEPIFWIWQKSMFVLGGLLWPLSFYPPALRYFAWLTPFPAMIASPAQWGQTGEAWLLAAGCLDQIFWAVTMLFALSRVDRAVLRAIQRGESA